MQALGGRHVALCTWREVEHCLGAGHVAVLPVGAASKEHGLHLPMASDWLQAEWLAARLVDRHPVLAWPILGYGHYPAFLEYPGSISVGRATFVSLVADVLRGIAGAGARACLVVNTGISTIAPLREALALVADATPMRTALANVGEGAAYRRTRAGLERQRRGGHADQCETAVMLALAPEQVRMEQAVAADGVEMEPGPLRRHDPAARNHSPTGAYGDPTLASADDGRALLAAMLEDLDTGLRQLQPKTSDG